MEKQGDYKEAESCSIFPAAIHRFRDRADDRQTDKPDRETRSLVRGKQMT